MLLFQDEEECLFHRVDVCASVYFLVHCLYFFTYEIYLHHNRAFFLILVTLSLSPVRILRIEEHLVSVPLHGSLRSLHKIYW